MITISIDDREKGILSELQNNICYNCLTERLKIERLDLGDIIISYNNVNYLIIERKSLNDLASSIKDGRYKCQKERMLTYKRNMHPKFKVLYIMEEFIPFDFDKYRDDTFRYNGLYISSLKSAYINSIFRDDCHVIKTNNIQETCFFLLSLVERLIRDPNKFFIDTPVKDESVLIKKKKITTNNILENQLSCIPGIGLKQVRLILEKFPNATNMYTFIKEVENNKERLLEVKGVGKKLFENICSMIGI